MKIKKDQIYISPSDLNNFVSCKYHSFNDQPAIIHTNHHAKVWMNNGDMHRDHLKGPAFVSYANAKLKNKFYMKNGMFHNPIKKAYITDVPNNSNKYYYEGIEYNNFYYNENKELIDNKGLFTKQLAKETKVYLEKEKERNECQNALLECYKKNGSLEQKLKSLNEKKQNLIDLQEEYSAYDLFMSCMHSNGIAYDVIKKKLPTINDEIGKILANVVDFEVFFEADDKKLNIFIKHPHHDERPIEMGSGAEKTLAAMAIRLALLSVSSLPKSDVFILDEPGTALDVENMDGFISILELIKTYFKTVILISHLDNLKDCVDQQIVIDKKDGFAHIAI